MKYLVIVHLEPGFESYAGSLEPMANKVKSLANLYDRVLNITCEDLGYNDIFPALVNFPNKSWIWGFDADYYKEEEPDKWIEGENYIRTTGHEYSEILDWMYELPKKASYTLVGGARNECLQDIYEIFEHLNLNVKVHKRLTY
jgi:hypothetical protein